MRSVGALFAGLFAALSAHAQAPQVVEGPGVKVGDTWIFNTLDGRGTIQSVSVNTIDEVGAKGIEMTSKSLDGKSVAKIHRTAGFNLVSIDSPAYKSSATPYYPNYSFPLQVGKTWRQRVELANSRKPDNTVRADLESRVVGWEMVTVPAGNFLALRIDTRGNYRGSNYDGRWSGRIEDSLWYAPEVRNAVRYEYKDTVDDTVYNHEVHELVRFWPGWGSP